MSTFCKVLMGGSLILMTLLFMAPVVPPLWPFSRPALLIPMTWWTMFLVNKWLVASPVLSLIDEAAEQADFMPIVEAKPEKAPFTATAPIDDELDLEEQPASAV